MTANLLLDDEMHGKRPPCWNREPQPRVRTRHGIDSETGNPIAVEIRDDWGSRGCKVHEGVGIGQPTPEYPNGTPYPVANNWNCAGCRWLPGGKT